MSSGIVQSAHGSGHGHDATHGGHHLGMTLTEPGSTGLPNGLMGMIFFLVSELSLFSGLIFGYLYIRSTHTAWPPAGSEHFPVGPATFNTAILVLSGFVMHEAQQMIKHGNRTWMIRLTIVTIILGAIFLGGQALEYGSLITNGMRLNLNTYGATFFTLTGLHGLHVTGGVIFLLIILIRTLRGSFSKGNHFAVDAATLYWHFVDVVWVVLYALFYLAG